MKTLSLIFVFAIGFFLPVCSHAQNSVHEDLRNMKNGESFRIVAQNGGKTTSTLKITKDKDRFNLGFDFDGIPKVSQVKVEYYKNGRKVGESPSMRGPNVAFDFDTEKQLVGHQTFIKNAEDDAIWPAVILIALCCVEAQVGSNGWSVGFDCDCLSGIMVAGGGSNGEDLAIDELRILPYPLDGGIEDLLKNSTVLVNR